MSRSYKKPYIGICTHSSEAMKKWKKQCNHIIRRIPVDSDKVYSYRKVNDPWDSPNDGKQYWDDTKARRK